MVLFCIIEDLQKKGKIYKIGKYEGNSLWLADDATLISSSIKHVEENIKVLIESGGEYGLNLSKSKTKILQVRSTKNIEKISEYSVEKEVQYLGINIGVSGRDIIRAYKIVWLE